VTNNIIVIVKVHSALNVCTKHVCLRFKPIQFGHAICKVAIIPPFIHSKIEKVRDYPQPA